MDITEARGVRLGEVVSFKPPRLSIEVQGRVLSYFEDEQGGNIFAVVQMLARGFKDFVNAKNKIYHYFDTSTQEVVPIEWFLQAIPSHILPAKPKVGSSMLADVFPSKLRSKGVIYITEHRDEDGVCTQAQEVRMQLMWYHYDPDSIESLADLPMNPYDLGSGFLCTLKLLLFNMFVSPLSVSRRRNELEWNIKSWRLILQAANGEIPASQCYEEIVKLEDPTVRETRIVREVFFMPERSIPLLVVIMNQWLNNFAEMDVYSAMHHATFHASMLQRMLDEFEEEETKKDKDPKRRRKEMREYEQQREEDLMGEDDSIITSGSATTYSSSTSEEEEILTSSSSEGDGEDSDSSEAASLSTEDIVESDDDSDDDE